ALSKVKGRATAMGATTWANSVDSRLGDCAEKDTAYKTGVYGKFCPRCERSRFRDEPRRRRRADGRVPRNRRPPSRCEGTHQTGLSFATFFGLAKTPCQVRKNNSDEIAGATAFHRAAHIGRALLFRRVCGEADLTTV